MTSEGLPARPRLLVVASTYPRWARDSEPAFVHELSRRLSERFEVHVVAPHAPGSRREEWLDGVHVRRYRYAPGAMESLIHDGGIMANLRRSRWKWLLLPSFFVAQMLSVRSCILSMRPQLIHVHWVIPQGIAVAVLRMFVPGIPPFVVTSHGGDLYSLNARPFRWLKRWVYRSAAAASTVSSAMAARYRSLTGEQVSAVLPMGADVQSLFTPDPVVERMPNELLFVGRLVEKKGLRLLIEALPDVLRAVPEVRLTVAGYGPERAALQALVERLELQQTVEFLGGLQQDALPALYRRAAVFVAPFVEAADGDQDGLPVALMEAVACECPVVAGNVEGVLDLLGDDPLALFPTGSREALADAVIDTLHNPDRSRIAATARRERLLGSIDWSVVAGRYADWLSAHAAPAAH